MMVTSPLFLAKVCLSHTNGTDNAPRLALNTESVGDLTRSPELISRVGPHNGVLVLETMLIPSTASGVRWLIRNLKRCSLEAVEDRCWRRKRAKPPIIITITEVITAAIIVCMFGPDFVTC
jgi:hypothetical protein